jgi:hypothetical protein
MEIFGDAEVLEAQELAQAVILGVLEVLEAQHYS